MTDLVKEAIFSDYNTLHTLKQTTHSNKEIWMTKLSLQLDTILQTFRYFRPPIHPKPRQATNQVIRLLINCKFCHSFKKQSKTILVHTNCDSTSLTLERKSSSCVCRSISSRWQVSYMERYFSWTTLLSSIVAFTSSCNARYSSWSLINKRSLHW